MLYMAVFLQLIFSVAFQFGAHVRNIYAKMFIPFCLSHSYGSNAHNIILKIAKLTEIYVIYCAST
jgi:hypothetical protein